jgi:hypothetical protein
MAITAITTLKITRHHGRRKEPVRSSWLLNPLNGNAPDNEGLAFKAFCAVLRTAKSVSCIRCAQKIRNIRVAGVLDLVLGDNKNR